MKFVDGAAANRSDRGSPRSTYSKFINLARGLLERGTGCLLRSVNTADALFGQRSQFRDSLHEPAWVDPMRHR